jgi:hypothetical protein
MSLSKIKAELEHVGPANEKWAHSPMDQCPADHIPKATAFYAALVLRAAAVLGRR